jgi:hypothetical protein
MSDLPVCVATLHMTGEVFVEDVQRARCCLFQGLSVQPSERSYVRRAREQVAAGERAHSLIRQTDTSRNDMVDVMHFLHPDGLGEWERLGRYEALAVQVIRFCKGRGFILEGT